MTRAELEVFWQTIDKEECSNLCRAMRRFNPFKKLGKVARVSCFQLVGDSRYRVHAELLRHFVRGRAVTEGHFRDTTYYQDMEDREGEEYATTDVWEYFDFLWGVLQNTKIIKLPFAIVEGDLVRLLNGKHRTCLHQFLRGTNIKCHTVSVSQIEKWRKAQHERLRQSNV